jgi:hypothetical protein
MLQAAHVLASSVFSGIFDRARQVLVFELGLREDFDQTGLPRRGAVESRWMGTRSCRREDPPSCITEPPEAVSRVVRP